MIYEEFYGIHKSANIQPSHHPIMSAARILSIVQDMMTEVRKKTGDGAASQQQAVYYYW